MPISIWTNRVPLLLNFILDTTVYLFINVHFYTLNFYIKHLYFLNHQYRTQLWKNIISNVLYITETIQIQVFNYETADALVLTLTNDIQSGILFLPFKHLQVEY